MVTIVIVLISSVFISSLTAYHGTNTKSEALTASAESVMNKFYSGCDVSKGCFGFPNKCIQSRSCKAAVSVEVENSRYVFELYGANSEPAYVAMGLSFDTIMGDDAGTECVLENGRVKAYSIWISTASTRNNVPPNVIRLLEASYLDSNIYCRFERDKVSTVRNKIFDLEKDKYHLLLGSGTKATATEVETHDIGRSASASARLLSDVSPFEAVSTKWVRVHGILMVVAWMGTGSIGIILARYFKQTWVSSPLFGINQWFIWHRVCMTITWSLSIAAFIIIFVEIDGWTKVANTHAILGTISTVLCFLQPFGALLRPSPTHKRRFIFNLLHFFVGNAAYILAITTIYFALPLAKAELPDWMPYILVGFVAFYVAYHVIFTIIDYFTDKKTIEANNIFSNDKPLKDAPYSSLRKFGIATFIVIAIAFSTTFSVIVGMSPIE